jgi:hypothetical protein
MKSTGCIEGHRPQAQHADISASLTLALSDASVGDGNRGGIARTARSSVTRFRHSFRFPTYSAFSSSIRRAREAMTFSRSMAHRMTVSSSTGGEGRIRTTRAGQVLLVLDVPVQHGQEALRFLG